MEKSKHFFCLLTPGRADMHTTVTEEEGKIFSRHAEYLKQKFAEKKILQAGTSFEAGQEHFAIVILSASGKPEAAALMAADPAVAQGLLKARITEYNVFLDRALV